MIRKQVNILLFCLAGILQLSLRASIAEAQINDEQPYMLENRLPVGVPDSGVIRKLRLLVENEPEARETF